MRSLFHTFQRTNVRVQHQDGPRYGTKIGVSDTYFGCNVKKKTPLPPQPFTYFFFSLEYGDAQSSSYMIQLWTANTRWPLSWHHILSLGQSKIKLILAPFSLNGIEISATRNIVEYVIYILAEYKFGTGGCRETCQHRREMPQRTWKRWQVVQRMKLSTTPLMLWGHPITGNKLALTWGGFGWRVKR